MSKDIQGFEAEAVNKTEQMMKEVVKNIDSTFGEGHAKNNPKLVVSFMETSFKIFKAYEKRKL
jgi:hypothetical protein